MSDVKVRFTKCTEAELSTVAKVEGQYYQCSDTGRLYLCLKDSSTSPLYFKEVGNLIHDENGELGSLKTRQGSGNNSLHYDTTIISSNDSTANAKNTFIAAGNNVVTKYGEYNSIISSSDSSIKSPNEASGVSSYSKYSSIISSSMSNIDTDYNAGGSPASNSSIIGGYRHELSGSNNIVAGGDSTKVVHSLNSATVGGSNNKIQSNSGRVESSAIIAGDDNTIDGGSRNHLKSVIVGGSSNKIANGDSTNFFHSDTIVGGYDNEITESYYSSIVGSYSSDIVNGSNQSVILGSYESYIDGSYQSAILGGYGNSISFKNSAVILGGNDLVVGGDESSDAAYVKQVGFGINYTDSASQKHSYFTYLSPLGNATNARVDLYLPNKSGTLALESDLATKYTKPSTGIPATDMTTAVQTSLSKADTALQTQTQANWTQTTTTAVDYIKNKPTLATVATSGKYSDLTGTPTNTWTAFVGASATADGTAGYVPAPGKGNQSKFFRADGTWQTVVTDVSGKLDKSGGTMTGKLTISTTAIPLARGKVTGLTAGTTELYKDGIVISNPATQNDLGWIRVTGTGESDTVMEIATGDDAGTGETIVFRGYNTSNAVGYQVNVPKKTGTIALTSDIPSLSGYATQTWVEGKGYITSQGTYANTAASGSAGTSTATWKSPLIYASINASHVLSGSAGTIPAASATSDGYMTSAQASKLAGIAAGANAYSLPTASNTTLGGVKTGAAVTDTTGMTAVHIKDGIIYYKDTNTTYESKAAASGGTAVSLVTTGEKATWNAKTSNTGTVTSVAVKMNGSQVGSAITTSGTIDLGTVITAHQDISGKANLSGDTFTGLTGFDKGIRIGPNTVAAPWDDRIIIFGDGSSGNPYAYIREYNDDRLQVNGNNELILSSSNTSNIKKGTSVSNAYPILGTSDLIAGNGISLSVSNDKVTISSSGGTPGITSQTSTLAIVNPSVFYSCTGCYKLTLTDTGFTDAKAYEYNGYFETGTTAFSALPTTTSSGATIIWNGDVTGFLTNSKYEVNIKKVKHSSTASSCLYIGYINIIV